MERTVTDKSKKGRGWKAGQKSVYHEKIFLSDERSLEKRKGKL